MLAKKNQKNGLVILKKDFQISLKRPRHETAKKLRYALYFLGVLLLVSRDSTAVIFYGSCSFKLKSSEWWHAIPYFHLLYLFVN